MNRYWMNPKGSALIVAMAIVILLAGLGSLLIATVHTRSLHVEVDLEDIKAFEAAEAGIDAATADINRSPVAQLWFNPATASQSYGSSSHVPTNQYATNLDTTVPAQNWIAVTTIDKRPLCAHMHTVADGTGSYTIDPLYQTFKFSGNINSPGCLGTELWTPATVNRSGTVGSRCPVTAIGDDTVPVNPAMGYDAASQTVPWNYISRPRWPTVSNNAASGTAATPENHIYPLQVGDVAFFTYTVDWLHDGIDNDNGGVADDITERNKYTVYSTGIHKGVTNTGVSQEGKVVTVEVLVESLDFDLFAPPSAALEIQFPHP